MQSPRCRCPVISRQVARQACFGLLARATVMRSGRRCPCSPLCCECPPCAELCSRAHSCEALELCSPGSASAAGTWAPPGTCILSTDLQMSAGRLAYLFMSGPTVAWSGGYLDPKAAAPPSPPSASGSSVGGGSGGCPAGFIDCGQGCIDVLNNAQVWGQGWGPRG